MVRPVSLLTTVRTDASLPTSCADEWSVIKKSCFSFDPLGKRDEVADLQSCGIIWPLFAYRRWVVSRMLQWGAVASHHRRPV